MTNRRIVAFDAIVPTSPKEQVYVDLNAVAAFIPVYSKVAEDVTDEHGTVIGLGFRNHHTGYHLILQDTYSSMHIMVGITDQNVEHLRSVSTSEFVLPVSVSQLYQ